WGAGAVRTARGPPGEGNRRARARAVRRGSRHGPPPSPRDRPRPGVRGEAVVTERGGRPALRRPVRPAGRGGGRGAPGTARGWSPGARGKRGGPAPSSWHGGAGALARETNQTLLLTAAAGSIC